MDKLDRLLRRLEMIRLSMALAQIRSKIGLKPIHFLLEETALKGGPIYLKKQKNRTIEN